MVRQRGKYDSAIIIAVNADENKLPLGYRFAALWSNMLVDVNSPADMIFDGETLQLESPVFSFYLRNGGLRSFFGSCH